MQVIEAGNLVTRPFALQTFRTADEIFTSSYEHSTISGNTVSFSVRAPSSSTLMSSCVYVRFRVRVDMEAAKPLKYTKPANGLYYGDQAKGLELCKSDVFAV